MIVKKKNGPPFLQIISKQSVYRLQFDSFYQPNRSNQYIYVFIFNQNYLWAPLDVAYLIKRIYFVFFSVI